MEGSRWYTPPPSPNTFKWLVTVSEATGENRLVVDLKEASTRTIHLVGGKAFSLGELFISGLPHPSGLCSNYKITRNGLDKLVGKLLNVGFG